MCVRFVAHTAPSRSLSVFAPLARGGGGGGGAHSYSVHLFVIAHVCAPLTRPRSHIIIQCDYGLYAQDIARYCFTRELAAVPVCGIHVI